MGTREEDRGTQEDLSAVRDRLRKRGVLPCGSKVCVRCHKGCGVVMAAYLSGLDEKEEIAEEEL
jgi:hypothetical protein